MEKGVSEEGRKGMYGMGWYGAAGVENDDYECECTRYESSPQTSVSEVKRGLSCPVRPVVII